MKMESLYSPGVVRYGMNASYADLNAGVRLSLLRRLATTQHNLLSHTDTTDTSADHLELGVAYSPTAASSSPSSPSPTHPLQPFTDFIILSVHCPPRVHYKSERVHSKNINFHCVLDAPVWPNKWLLEKTEGRGGGGI
ncbi:hypothetical protein J6590_079099 [Homalodisca vitripennis]|nr:hypothetical protein J6590_079099 [Homalodisca vitripennis]